MEYRFDQIAYNSTEKKQPEDSDRAHYIGLEHLDSGCFEVTRWGSDVTPAGEKLVMHKGDILFGKRRAYQRKVGIAPFDGVFSAHGMVLRPKENVIDKDYFPFFIASDQFMERAVRISVGGLSPTINWKDLKEQVFDIPTIEEQQRIADKLWAAYELKESYKRLLAATDEIVKSRFIEMFQDTKTTSIGDLFETTSGGTPSSKVPEYYEGGTIPWLTSSEVGQGMIHSTNGFITESGLKNSSAKWVPVNTVVVAMYGATVGKVGLLNIPCTTNQAVCCILPRNDTSSLFVYYAIKNKETWMISQAVGAAQPNISQSVIKKMEIPLPGLSQQNAFVEFAQQADKSKFELKRAIEKIDKVMRALMQ